MALWAKVKPYGATALETFSDSTTPGAAVEIAGPAGKFVPVVGREALKPAAGTEVLAKFADGAAALTRHAHGKGHVYVAGFFPGSNTARRFAQKSTICRATSTRSAVVS